MSSPQTSPPRPTGSSQEYPQLFTRDDRESSRTSRSKGKSHASVSKEKSSSVSGGHKVEKSLWKLLDKALSISAYAFVVFAALGASLYDYGLLAETCFQYTRYAAWSTGISFGVKIIAEISKLVWDKFHEKKK